jgi:hypothetical protein
VKAEGYLHHYSRKEGGDGDKHQGKEKGKYGTNGSSMLHLTSMGNEQEKSRNSKRNRKLLAPSVAAATSI